MTSFFYKTLTILSFLFLSMLQTNLSLANPIELSDLLIPKEKIPANTQLKVVPRSDKKEIPRNPYLSKKEDSFKKHMIDKMFKGKVKPEQISEILFSVYQEKNEIGVFAFKFINESSAKEAEKTLGSPNNDRESRFIKGEVLVWVWRDSGVSKETFDAFKGHVQTVLK